MGFKRFQALIWTSCSVVRASARVLKAAGSIPSLAPGAHAGDNQSISLSHFDVYPPPPPTPFPHTLDREQRTLGGVPGDEAVALQVCPTPSCSTGCLGRFSPEQALLGAGPLAHAQHFGPLSSMTGTWEGPLAPSPSGQVFQLKLIQSQAPEIRLKFLV